MADYNSSLPIRTEADGDVVAAIVDKVTPANSWDIDANGAGLVSMVDAAGNQIVIDSNGNLSTLVTDGTDVLEINADGSINVADMSAVRYFITNGGILHPWMDCNGDGVVNVADMSCVRYIITH